MRRSDFHYPLPPELIAQSPPALRSGGRMLCVEEHGLRDARIVDLPGELRAGDLLVMNDTRVIRARLVGVKASGGRCEALIERVLDGGRALAQLRASKAPKAGSRLAFADGALTAEVIGRADDLFEIAFETDDLYAALERYGQLPLPPYIERPAGGEDDARYQTLWAAQPGAVAAPTAGLHFDEALLAAIAARGVDCAQLTLHVGAGTFQPLRSDDLTAHRMHHERVRVSAGLAAQAARARARGGRIVAVGTTVVRALESAWIDGRLQAFEGETALFIRPGYRFRAVDALLTNFHLPESTLLMLVCAFAGYRRVMDAYAHAVAQRYRFFSYGDAMWLPAPVG